MLPLTAADLKNRVGSHTYTTFMNAAYFIKSGVFTVASLAAIQILALPTADWRETIVRGSFWVASLGFTMLTVVSWTRGGVLTNARMNWKDLFYPLCVGVSEYGLFLILIPTTGANFVWWYLILFAHGFFAVLLIHNRIVQTNLSEDFDLALRDLATEYVKWMRDDRRGASMFTFGILVIFALSLTFPVAGKNCIYGISAIWLHVVVGLAMFAAAIMLTIKASTEYGKILDRVQSLESVS